MSVDVYRGTSGVQLPKEVSSEIWTGIRDTSAVMRLARRTDLPGQGKTIQVVTGDPEADWVDETDEISVSRPSFGAKSMQAYKLGVIVPFSNEFRRDVGALYAECLRALPAALARKFDATVFHGSAPGSNFDTLASSPTQAIKSGTGANTTYKGLVKALSTALAGGADADPNGFAMARLMEPTLLESVDGSNRPIFASATSEKAFATLLGRNTAVANSVYKSGSPATLGFLGDWSKAVWGQVQGVSISISDQATIADGTTTVDVDVTPSSGTATAEVEVPNLLNLWQRDMFAVKATIEVGFIVRNDGYFVRLTDGTVA